MRVRRIGFLGVRTNRVAETTAFFREVVGLGTVATAEARTVTQLPTGALDFVEVFAGDFRDSRLIPDEAEGVFVAFIVEDLEGAWAEVKAAGLETVGDIVWAEEAFSNPNYAGTGWFFVRGPDSNIYVFQQLPD
jgi:hypothetical protein